MFETDQEPNVRDNAFIRRMRAGRLRQLTITFVSLLAAVLGVYTLSPTTVGGFSFYSINLLLILNAIFAYKQYQKVIRPIAKMLKHMQDIEDSVRNDKFNIARLYNPADDEFACLAASMDNLVEKLAEKARVANERALRHVAVVQATPFTFFTVSSSGKVFSVIKDHYNLVPLLELAAGKMPSEKRWGKANFESYRRAVKAAFEHRDMRWFDMRFPATADQPEHNVRSTVAPLNDLSALVVMGDMPAIDKLVDDMSSARPTPSSRKQKYTALKHLAASVAHDGRNVFAVLSNLVALNRQSTDPNVREQTEIAEDAIRRGTNLMTELMQYAGEMKYQLQRVATVETCRKLYANPTLMALVPDNIKVVVDVPDEPMPDIDADPSQAWKVSFNLVKNAVEAIGNAPGRIWLTARPHVLTEEESHSFRCAGPMPTGPGVMTSVVDDGPGIEPSILEHVFDPYFSSKGTGRGLGLATVFSIVDAHGGAIRVSSQLGRGSTFEIFLPASQQSAAHEVKEYEPVANGAFEILLVDDDPAILQTTGLVLRALKITAHVADNQESALRTMRKLRERLRAVIVDAHLPQAADLLRTVRDEFPKTTCVLSSGTSENDLHKLIQPALYDRFLAKPYAIADLRKALNTPPPPKNHKSRL